MTMTEAGSALETRMREAIAERSLLEHPFYQAWSEGTLELERLQDYARQYFHFERAFPRFLSAIHARTESPPIRQLLLSNLWDEEYGERNHPALWLEFAEALGVSAEEVEGAEPHPQTTALIEHYAEVAEEAPVAEALATLFAYESQVPASRTWRTRARSSRRSRNCARTATPWLKPRSEQASGCWGSWTAATRRPPSRRRRGRIR